MNECTCGMRGNRYDGSSKMIVVEVAAQSGEVGKVVNKEEAKSAVRDAMNSIAEKMRLI